MSHKRPRTRLERATSRTVRRVAMSVVIAGLVTTLVVVFIDRSNQDDTHVSTTAPAAAPTTALARVAALNGTYDVTVTVLSAEYGATWPGARLTVGQRRPQRWSITCRRDTCTIDVASGRVAEDFGTATVASTDDSTFSVSASTPASPDNASLPPGCGAVNAADVQVLTLHATDAGATFTGDYRVHHPTIHVEGPIAGGIGSCDSFNASFGITAVRR